MKSSTSLGLKGVIFDANVLSLIAKASHLDLLPQFFALPAILPQRFKVSWKPDLETGFLT